MVELFKDSCIKTLREKRGGRVLGYNSRQEIKRSHQIQQPLAKDRLMFPWLDLTTTQDRFRPDCRAPILPFLRAFTLENL